MAFGINIDQRKTNKKNHIIDLFRLHGSLSKVQAKDLSGYSMDTILSVFNHLIEENLIYETEGEQKQKGRRATFFQLKSYAHVYLGITFNQSGIYTSLISFSNEVIDTKITETDIFTSKDEFIAEFTKHLNEFIKTNSDYFKNLRSIGCGIPGILQAENNRYLNYTLMPYLNNFDIKEFISSFFPNKEIFIEHNIKSMTSYFFSHSDIITRFKKILYISVRSGVASGFIYNGEIITDHGEIGHMKVSESKERCICGKTGCLDLFFSYMSISNAVKPYMKLKKIRPVSKDIQQEYKTGNSKIIEIIDERYCYFAEAVHDAANLLCPDLIIISGAILGCFDDPVKKLTDHINSVYQDTGYVRNFQNAEIKFMDLGAEIAAEGCCYYLIRKDWGYEEV